jgi:hypothetical protein
VQNETDTSFIWFCSKDVRLPVQLQRAMAAEAEAAREARAKVTSLLWWNVILFRSKSLLYLQLFFLLLHNLIFLYISFFLFSPSSYKPSLFLSSCTISFLICFCYWYHHSHPHFILFSFSYSFFYPCPFMLFFLTMSSFIIIIFPYPSSSVTCPHSFVFRMWQC